MADEPKDKDREAELKRQEDVRKAVHDATHDKSGKPTPIIAEFPTAVKAFGGEKK